MNLLATILLAAFCSTASAQSLKTNGKFVSPGTPVVLYSVARATESPATADYMDLYKYTLPANTLSHDGDSLYIECMSSTTATSFSKDNRTRFAGVNLAEGSTTSTAQFWRTFGRFVRRSATTYNSYFTRMRDTTISSSVEFIETFDPTVDNEIICQGKGGGTAGDLQGVAFKVIYEPAP